MKKTMLIIAASLILLLSANANANATKTWTTSAIDFDDSRFYAWDIHYNLGPEEVITGAKITYYNLYDHDFSTEDKLFTHLMDDRLGEDGDVIFAGADEDAEDGYWKLQLERMRRHWSWKWEYVAPVEAEDAWDGLGPLVGVHVPHPWIAETFSYDLATLGLLDELNAFMADGWISIGIDPDCHFTTPKVVFQITTATRVSVIPAPGAVLLGGIGVVLVGWLRRRRTL